MISGAARKGWAPGSLREGTLGEFQWNSLGNESVLNLEVPMEIKSCRVTVRDMEGVAHTVEVTASTLYEPVLPWWGGWLPAGSH